MPRHSWEGSCGAAGRRLEADGPRMGTAHRRRPHRCVCVPAVGCLFAESLGAPLGMLLCGVTLLAVTLIVLQHPSRA